MKKSEKRMLVRGIIDAANSQFVSVSFIKKDGSTRVMNVQPFAIRSHIVGEAASESMQRAVATRKENHPNLYNCWDVQANSARSINLDTVFLIKAQGKVHNFPIETDEDDEVPVNHSGDE